MNSLILALELKTCRSNPTHHYSSEHSVLIFKPVLRIWEDWIAYLYALFLKSKNTFKNNFSFEKKIRYGGNRISRTRRGAPASKSTTSLYQTLRLNKPFQRLLCTPKYTHVKHHFTPCSNSCY